MVSRNQQSSVSMSAVQKLALVDVALSHRNPRTYLLAVAHTFGYLGREADAQLVMQMARLAEAQAYETLAGWRAEWAEASGRSK